MFGNLEEMQQQMREGLTGITVHAEAGGGVIRIEGNAAREITNVQIDPEFLKSAETEELEDLLLVAMNKLVQEASEKEAAHTQEKIKDMMPPGLGGLGNLFG